jgi:hypothetical protein
MREYHRCQNHRFCLQSISPSFFRYFLENFKFLLSYPGRGAFYIFCGSLALANTGIPFIFSFILSDSPQANHFPSFSEACPITALSLSSQSCIQVRNRRDSVYQWNRKLRSILQATAPFRPRTAHCASNTLRRYGVTEQDSNRRYTAVPQVM